MFNIFPDLSKYLNVLRNRRILKMSHSRPTLLNLTLPLDAVYRAHLTQTSLSVSLQITVFKNAPMRVTRAITIFMR